MKIGSLFTGYGGLDQAVSSVTGAETVWVSDVDKGANKILAHRYPDVPNLGDITQIDFTNVEPVDILTGGFPCQDLSHAGKRAGLKEGTRSGLWSHMARAIRELQPKLVVVENVRGLLSADAPGDVEPCPWCVGDGSTVNLRALGVVLADLADLGFDAEWVGLRCADVGGCHGRFRVFLVAYQDTEQLRRFQRGKSASLQTASGRPPTIGSRSDGTLERTVSTLSDVAALLPTPNPFHAGNEEEPEDWRRRRLDVFERTGTRHGPALGVVAKSITAGDPLTPDRYMPDEKLLPTPMAAEGTKPSNTMGIARREQSGQVMLTNVIVTLAGLDETELLPTPIVSDAKGTSPEESFNQLRTVHKLFPTPTTQDPRGGESQLDRNTPPLNAVAEFQRHTFGDYAKAIHRWEQVINRPAPAPTELRPTGRGRLSPAFVEWMMGLPEGWVTDVPELSWAEQLKALGNGVVPQQAAAALTHLLGRLP